MTRRQRRAARIAALGIGVLGVGACQVLSGLSGYQETGGSSASTTGATGGAATTTSTSTTATTSTAGATGGATTSSAASATGGATTASSTSGATGGAATTTSASTTTTTSASTTSSASSGTGGAGVTCPTGTDYTVDPANCGWCGHACEAGQTCGNSLCTPTLVAKDLSTTLSGISVGDAYVYWSVQNVDAGGVGESNLAMLGPGSPIVYPPSDVPALTFSGGDLYYTDLGSPKIGLFQMATTGSTAGTSVQYATSVTASSVGAVVAGGSPPEVFFAADVSAVWNVYRVDPGNKTTVTMVDSWPDELLPGPPLAHDGQQAYWFNGAHFQTAGATGIGSAPVTSPTVGSVHQLAADPASAGGFLYWTEGTDLYRIPKTGSGTAYTFPLTISSPAGLVSDGTYVYWIDAPASCTSASTLSRTRGDGTGPVQLLASTKKGCAGTLAQDGTYLYYSFVAQLSASVSIYRVPK